MNSWAVVEKRTGQTWMIANTRAEAYEISHEYNALFASENLTFVVRKV